MYHIKGFNNYLLTEDFEIYSLASERNLTPRLNRDGYKEVYLKPSKYHKKVMIGIHQIVCLVFYGECPSGMEIRHLDGDKLNNHKDNLKYGTRKENVEDSVKHGSFKNRDNRKKFTDSQVREIRDKLSNGGTIYRLHKDYKVSRYCIRNIKNNVSYKYVHD
jgi:hypothetical protein